MVSQFKPKGRASTAHRLPVDEAPTGHREHPHCPCKPEKVKLKKGTMYLHKHLVR